MNKKDFFRNYTWAITIFYLLWIGWQNEDTYIVKTINNLGIVTITITLFCLGIGIDYVLNKEESFIKTKVTIFNSVIFFAVLIMAFLIRFKLI